MWHNIEGPTINNWSSAFSHSLLVFEFLKCPAEFYAFPILPIKCLHRLEFLMKALGNCGSLTPLSRNACHYMHAQF